MGEPDSPAVVPNRMLVLLRFVALASRPPVAEKPDGVTSGVVCFAGQGDWASLVQCGTTPFFIDNAISMPM